MLSAVVLFDSFGLKKCVLPDADDGADPLIASVCKVITVPLLSVNVSSVPTAMLAKSDAVTVAASGPVDCNEGAITFWSLSIE